MWGCSRTKTRRRTDCHLLVSLTQTPLWWIYMCVKSPLGVNHSSLCVLTKKCIYRKSAHVVFLCVCSCHIFISTHLPFGKSMMVIDLSHICPLEATLLSLPLIYFPCPPQHSLFVLHASISPSVLASFPIVCLTTMEVIVPQAVGML